MKIIKNGILLGLPLIMFLITFLNIGNNVKDTSNLMMIGNVNAQEDINFSELNDINVSEDTNSSNGNGSSVSAEGDGGGIGGGVWGKVKGFLEAILTVFFMTFLKDWFEAILGNVGVSLGSRDGLIFYISFGLSFVIGIFYIFGDKFNSFQNIVGNKVMQNNGQGQQGGPGGGPDMGGMPGGGPDMGGMPGGGPETGGQNNQQASDFWDVATGKVSMLFNDDVSREEKWITLGYIVVTIVLLIFITVIANNLFAGLIAQTGSDAEMGLRTASLIYNVLLLMWFGSLVFLIKVLFIDGIVTLYIESKKSDLGGLFKFFGVTVVILFLMYLLFWQIQSYFGF